MPRAPFTRRHYLKKLLALFGSRDRAVAAASTEARPEQCRDAAGRGAEVERLQNMGLSRSQARRAVAKERPGSG